jgi:ATP-dependent Clp protease adaptor protein ClpS
MTRWTSPPAHRAAVVHQSPGAGYPTGDWRTWDSPAERYTPGVAGATPDVLTPPRTDEDVKPRGDLLRPYTVVLHNDDHNDMLYVVQCLLKAVPTIGRRRAVEIMFEAHRHGKARVTSCPLELAELYRDRLEGFGLTATIEKA